MFYIKEYTPNSNLIQNDFFGNFVEIKRENTTQNEMKFSRYENETKRKKTAFQMEQKRAQIQS